MIWILYVGYSSHKETFLGPRLETFKQQVFWDTLMYTLRVPVYSVDLIRLCRRVGNTFSIELVYGVRPVHQRLLIIRWCPCTSSPTLSYSQCPMAEVKECLCCGSHHGVCITSTSCSGYGFLAYFLFGSRFCVNLSCGYAFLDLPRSEAQD